MAMRGNVEKTANAAKCEEERIMDRNPCLTKMHDMKLVLLKY